MSKRSRWKPLADLAIVLVVVVVAVCFMIRTAMVHERKEFLGQIDSKSGYRCRFTISSDWKTQHQGADEFHSQIDQDLFRAPPSSPIRPMQVWMIRHLLQRQANGPPAIHRITLQGKTLPGIHFQDGYPDLEPIGPTYKFTQQHFRIDGHPATLVHVEGETLRGPVLGTRGTWLYVSIPEQSIVYQLGATVLSSDFDQVNSEMQAIIASFHIEKVPSGGNR